MTNLLNYIPIYKLLIISVIVAVIYFYFKHSFTYLKRRNIPFIEPSFPLGNVNINFFHGYGQELQKLYAEFKKRGATYGGFYLATKPVFFPINPDILKKVLTKDFQYFYDRGIYINEEHEYITAHLFALRGTAWKSLRSKFTPTFSITKLKNMVDIMLEKVSKLEENLQELSSTSTPFEAKDLASRITTDIFCSICFGIECNSLSNPNADFRKYTRILLHNNCLHTMKITIALTAPQLFKKLNLNFIKTEFRNFFIKAITEVVEYREKNSISRPDILNMLINLKNNLSIDDDKMNEKIEDGITMKQLIAQCFILFIAGFDTSANTINYCLFELTQNHSLQSKLRHEIHDVLKKNDGKLTYEVITKMTLLDKVIAETLRKYPPAHVLNRECTRDYHIPGTQTVIETGTSVMISILGLHYDPEYYPNPQVFDPERFSEELKSKRNPYTYLPFGEGPKNCIGMRFGLLQTKIGIIYLLKNYKYTLNPQTKLPLKFKSEGILLSTDGDIWIDVIRL